MVHSEPIFAEFVSIFFSTKLCVIFAFKYPIFYIRDAGKFSP